MHLLQMDFSRSLSRQGLEMTIGECDSGAADYDIRKNASSAHGFLASSK
jgi:hypothetical protein